MLDESLSTRWFRGALACAGLGLLAGALETVGLAATLRLGLGFTAFIALGLLDLLVMAVIGAFAGLLGGAVHLVMREEYRSRALALQAGVAGTLLCGWYLWVAAAQLHADGRTLAAILMAVMPFALGGVVYFNAAYWWRKVELGAEFKLGWLAFAAGVALVVVTGSAAAHTARYTGGTGTLAGDRSVLLVTVDGLGRDAVFGPAAPAAALGDGALRYHDVVTPLPASRPAAATVLTGLHPLRNGVISDARTLARSQDTVAKVLEHEGYATGAFVSSSLLDAGSGLAQGFLTYDDSVRPGPRGVWHLSLMRRLGEGVVAHRPAAVTTDRALAWIGSHRGMPFFAWVHYDAPVVDPATGPATVVAQVARLEAALKKWKLDGSTLRVVVGTFGQTPGMHGEAATEGLSDLVVEVPLIVRAPGTPAVVTDIQPQVRLMDVAPTVLGYLKIDGLDPVEGVNLLGYALRTRKAPMWCALVGRDGPDPVADALIGLRNNGVKYVRDLSTGKEHLYDVVDDPSERKDLVATQPAALAEARGLVSSEAAALRRLLGASP